MKLFIPFTRLNKKGDTIVEVMIVLAVLGFAIGIAYATANRSSTAILAANQSAAASGLLQSQIEKLRSNTTTTSPNFCFDGTGVVPNTSATDIDDRCKQGGPSDDRYSINIAKTGGPQIFTYKATATWTGPDGETYNARLDYIY
jgi:type II secretory pathway pseudopilin PulG